VPSTDIGQSNARVIEYAACFARRASEVGDQYVGTKLQRESNVLGGSNLGHPFRLDLYSTVRSLPARLGRKRERLS